LILNRPNFLKLLVPLLAFAATCAAIALLNRSSSPRLAGSFQNDGAFVAPGASTDAQIAGVEKNLAANPKATSLYATLGNLYLQKVRETADSGFYRRAQVAFEQGLERKPRDAGILTGLASLALARHHFREGLHYGLEAHAEAPDVVRPYGTLVDAQIELGRYRDAGRTLQRMVDLKPNLASYARVSYFRELHGDLAGATRAMRLAVSAGGDAAENVAYVQTLLGNLEFEHGRLGAAEHAYRLSLAHFPAYVAATAGLAKVRAAHGDLGAAIGLYRKALAHTPTPELALALAEVELAAGRTADARAQIAFARKQEAQAGVNGERTHTEVALLEANHGDPLRGVALARRAWHVAPSVRSADALGWALTRAGRPLSGLTWATRALKLGSIDPLFLYHAGMAAKAAGQRALARRYLARSLAHNPRFSPLYAPRARKVLART
jgi:tetratricopeptide (TPR) repeat protein